MLKIDEHTQLHFPCVKIKWIEKETDEVHLGVGSKERISSSGAKPAIHRSGLDSSCTPY